MVENSCIANSDGFTPYRRALGGNAALHLRQESMSIACLSKLASVEVPEAESTAHNTQNILRVKIALLGYDAQIKVARAAAHAARSVDAVSKVSMGTSVFVYRKNAWEGPATVVGRQQHLVLLSMAGKLYRSAIGKIRMVSTMAGVTGQARCLHPDNPNDDGKDIMDELDVEETYAKEKLEKIPRLGNFYDVNDESEMGENGDPSSSSLDAIIPDTDEVMPDAPQSSVVETNVMVAGKKESLDSNKKPASITYQPWQAWGKEWNEPRNSEAQRLIDTETIQTIRETDEEAKQSRQNRLQCALSTQRSSRMVSKNLTRDLRRKDSWEK